MKRSWRLQIGLLLLVLLGVGLALGIGWQSERSFVDSDQAAIDEQQLLEIEPGLPVGQTFVARHAGLSGIEFSLIPRNSAPLSLTLHLREEVQSKTDLVTAHLSLPPQAEPGFYRFDFPLVRDSHAEYYYAFLDAADAGVQVGGAKGATYLDGAAHHVHQPLDAQTTFRLVYTPRSVVLDLAKAAIGWLRQLMLAALVFVLPGWALLTWLFPGRRPAWPVMLGLAVGSSLALYPTIMLWMDLVGLHPGGTLAWLPMVMALALLVWRHRDWRPRHAVDAVQAWARSDALWPDLTLILILFLTFAVRLLVVRTMETALWADSYEHTVMTQLILDHGGLFDSWEPYTPYQSLTVHFGFPTASAVLAWLTGQSSTETVLLVGQLMNGFAALTLYPLAVRIAKGNRWAGVGTVIAAGLLSPMPAFYVNWGRFAQLTGQVILPVALWLMWEAVERRSRPWRAVVLAGLAVSGMALAYYRMPLYYATFVVAWLIGWGLPHWRLDAEAWLRGLSRLLLIGAIALPLLLPLVLRLAGGQLASGLGSGITKSPAVDILLQDYRFWRNVRFYVPIPMLVAAILAWIVSIVRRSWVAVAIGLWVLVLAALPAGRLIRLPGASYVGSFAILIAMYIPISLLIGWLVGEVAAWLSRAGKQHALAPVLVVLSLWATWGQVKIVDPWRVMVTHPDMQAMEWIRQNTPEDSLFLVEGFFYQGYSATGSDAGWWIPILADRRNNMPPQYALLVEVPTEPGYSQAVVDLVVQLGTVSPSTPEGIQLLCDWGFTHAYIGQRQGEVGDGADLLFSEQDLTDSPAFSQVYKQDRVSVYSMNPEVCRSAP